MAIFKAGKIKEDERFKFLRSTLSHSRKKMLIFKTRQNTENDKICDFDTKKCQYMTYYQTDKLSGRLYTVNAE